MCTIAPRPHKAQSEYIQHIQKRSLDIDFPSCHYLGALGRAGLECREQGEKVYVNHFVKEIQHLKHKLHHLLPEIRDVQSNLKTNQTENVF